MWSPALKRAGTLHPGASSCGPQPSKLAREDRNATSWSLILWSPALKRAGTLHPGASSCGPQPSKLAREDRNATSWSHILWSPALKTSSGGQERYILEPHLVVPSPQNLLVTAEMLHPGATSCGPHPSKLAQEGRNATSYSFILWSPALKTSSGGQEHYILEPHLVVPALKTSSRGKKCYILESHIMVPSPQN